MAHLALNVLVSAVNGGRAGGGILNSASQPSGRLLRPPPPPSTVSKQINSSEPERWTTVLLLRAAGPSSRSCNADRLVFFNACSFFPPLLGRSRNDADGQRRSRPPRDPLLL